MTGRWEEVGPGRSRFRPAAEVAQLIGPDALEPYVDPVALAAMREMQERWRGSVWPRVDLARERGRSQGDRRRLAAQVFGDPLPAGPDPEDRAVAVEPRVPVIWDRTLVPVYEFRAMAVGARTFGIWYGANVPEAGDVVVYVEHSPYRKPSPFGPSVAFLLGDVQVLEMDWGTPTKHVASLLALRGIGRSPVAGTWGFSCADCGWWDTRVASAWRFSDQAEALMAATAVGMVVTLQGLLCKDCAAAVPAPRRAQIGYERQGAAGE